MDLDSIRSIVDQYRQHGWELRRVALSGPSLREFGTQFSTDNPGVLVREDPNESLWFSRRSYPDREAWELRRLTGSPFALVAILEDLLPDEEREALLRDTERRMFDGSHPEPTSH